MIKEREIDSYYDFCSKKKDRLSFIFSLRKMHKVIYEGYILYSTVEISLETINSTKCEKEGYNNEQ